MDMTYPCRIEGATWLAWATEEGGKKGMGPAACPSFCGTRRQHMRKHCEPTQSGWGRTRVRAMVAQQRGRGAVNGETTCA